MNKVYIIGVLTSGALLLALIGVVFFSGNGYSDYRRLQVEKAELVVQNQQYREENWRLRDQVERLQNDLAYIGQVARSEFGMVGQDDLVYRFSQSEATKARQKR